MREEGDCTPGVEGVLRLQEPASRLCPLLLRLGGVTFVLVASVVGGGPLLSFGLVARARLGPIGALVCRLWGRRVIAPLGWRGCLGCRRRHPLLAPCSCASVGLLQVSSKVEYASMRLSST